MLTDGLPEQTERRAPILPQDSDEIVRLRAELTELRRSYIELLQQHVKLLNLDRQRLEQAEKTDMEQSNALRLNKESGGYSGEGLGVLLEGNPHYPPKDK
ncbi:MAG: hypothetical protein LBM64_06490 [Deltaproteobacteria bacterium]|nr:hypothetical protein [Deltaproteobacteria bacterium]